MRLPITMVKLMEVRYSRITQCLVRLGEDRKTLGSSPSYDKYHCGHELLTQFLTLQQASGFWGLLNRSFPITHHPPHLDNRQV